MLTVDQGRRLLFRSVGFLDSRRPQFPRDHLTCANELRLRHREPGGGPRTFRPSSLWL